MKRFQLVVFLLLFIGYAYGQDYLCLTKKVGSKEWGYIDANGEFVIQPKYRKCFDFSSDGLAVVLNSGSKQYTFINAKGEPLATEVTTFRLMEIFGFGVKGFSNGMAAIRVDDKWGFLNTEGKLAVPTKYDKVTEFYGGYASGEIANKSYIISRDGTETPVEGSNVIEVKHFSDGLAPFTTDERTSGFVDTNGKIVIPAKFQSVGYFIDGLAWAKLPDGQVGYIDKSGDWVIQPQFEAAKEFDSVSKMARIKTDGQWGYVSSTGEILNMSLESYGDFSEGLSYGKKGGKVGFFDNKGNWVIDAKFEATGDFKNGFAPAKENGLWGFIDKGGQWVIEPKFASVKSMEAVK